MTFLSLLAFLKRIPSSLWLGLLGVAIIAVSWLSVLSFGQRKYTAGYAQALARATLVRVDTVDRVVARTDTVIKRVTQRIVEVDTLIAQVPESIRVAIPSVDTALKACTALAQDCATLRASVLTERTAWAERDTALRLTVVAKNDTVRTLGKRWTRKVTILSMIIAAGAGFTAGRK